LWLLLAVALALIGVGEFAYIRDSFDGTPSFRFNTVFKAGYQAWFLMAIVAGCIAFWNRAWLGARTRRVWQVGLGCLALLALAYPVVATYSRSVGFDRSPTLDGMAWLEKSAPTDAGDGPRGGWAGLRSRRHRAGLDVHRAPDRARLGRARGAVGTSARYARP